MMRLPFFPTLIVAAAVATMILLGVWQLQRAEWKEGLIADLERSQGDRAASVTCTMNGRPEVRAGRNLAGEVGYRYLIPCRAGEEAVGGAAARETIIDIGWSKRPDAVPSVALTRAFTGTWSGGGQSANRTFVLDAPVPPLEQSGVPSPADLPNNHLLYAVQWFFFAAAAAVIYLLALRRRRRSD